MKHDTEWSTALRWLLPVLGAVLIALTLATSASAAIYGITDIGTLGGPTSEAHAINNRGEVTGTADTSYPTRGGAAVAWHAFRYKSGQMTDLTPGPPELGPEGDCGGCTAGYAINAAGDVAGSVSFIDGSGAKVWKADGLTITPYSGEADGINDADEVVGSQYRQGAWLYQGNNKETIFLTGEHLAGCPRLEAQTGAAYAINDLGQIAGWALTGLLTPGSGSCGEEKHAFLFSGGTMHDLGTLGGIRSQATALNERGMVVGYSETTGATTNHAFSYRHGKMSDLGTLPSSKESWANAVNNSGEIVGTSGEEVVDEFGLLTGRPGHAFLYLNGVMLDLDSLIPRHSGWTLTTANGINDRGEIVGTGTHDGVKRGFILRPRWLWF